MKILIIILLNFCFILAYSQECDDPLTVDSLKLDSVKAIYKNGNIYTGSFINEQRSGKGVLLIKEQLYVDADWKNDTIIAINSLYNTNNESVDRLDNEGLGVLYELLEFLKISGVDICRNLLSMYDDISIRRKEVENLCKMDYENESHLTENYYGIFSEGLAIIRINGRQGYINKCGEIVIKCHLENATKFNNGKAVVKLNKRWIYIDKNGDYLKQYDE